MAKNQKGPVRRRSLWPSLGLTRPYQCPTGLNEPYFGLIGPYLDHIWALFGIIWALLSLTGPSLGLDIEYSILGLILVLLCLPGPKGPSKTQIRPSKAQ